MSPTIFVLTTAAATGAVTAPAAAWALGRAGAPIPVRRAAVLAAAGVTVVTTRWLTGGWPGWWLPVPVLLTVVAVPLALADLRHLRLPDVLTLPAYPLLGAAIGAAALGGGGLSLAVRAAAGALLFGTAHALVARAAPGSLGAGDVKLSGSLGAVLGAAGWPALALAAVLAALFSLAIAVAYSISRRSRVRTHPAPTSQPADSADPTPEPRRLPVPAARPAPTPHPVSVAAAASVRHPTPTPSARPAPAPHPAPYPARHPAPTPSARPAPAHHPTTRLGGHRVPHGPALLAATWLCALFPGAP
ncbi:prepilin peptidase [Amycolatopsis sp. NBC_01488]|uniref:prepilin peptidase n=1 Tax=Amycolatopsis sp. NBC_01488 TaxID=2903563 RepID=UPI002E27B12E|nr:prepilin peptidase [Amycolatopsis sp. NBC_01488]